MAQDKDGNVESKPEGTEKKLLMHRSPSYPFIPLGRAIEFLEKIYSQYKSHPFDEALAHALYEYKVGGSQARRIHAALKDYGLIESVESKGRREFKITDAGFRIIHKADNLPDLLKRAALLPAIHQELWEKYGSDIPVDSIISQYLILDRKYNPEYVRYVIDNFRQTISYAKLEKGVNLVENEEFSNKGPEGEDHDSNNRNKTIPPDIKTQGGGSPSLPTPAPTTQIMALQSQMREVKFPLSSGDATLFFPKDMEAEDFDLLEDYLGAFKKAEKRAADKRAALLKMMEEDAGKGLENVRPEDMEP